MAVLVGIGLGLLILLAAGFFAGRMLSSDDGKKKILGISILIVAGAIGIFLPLVFLYKTLNIFRLYQEVESAFTNIVGINRYLVNGILLLVFSPYALFVGWLVSFRSYKRKIARGAILVYLAVFNLSMYFLTKDVIARHDTGELLKWYAMTPAGCQYYDSPGFDPKYGIKLQPLTPEARTECDGATMGRKRLLSGTDVEYFNTMTGEPNYYYQRDAGGRLTLYNGPGFDPRTGQKLLPINSIIIEEFEAQQQKEEEERQSQTAREEADRRAQASVREKERKYHTLISNPDASINSAKSVETIVLAGNAETSFLAHITQKLSSAGAEPVTDLLAVGVYSTGCYSALMRGESACIRHVDLAPFADYLLVVGTTSDYSTNKQLYGLRNCHLNVTSMIYTAAGKLVRRDAFLINGVGDHNETAEKAALERAADSLKSIFVATCMSRT